MRMLKTMAAFGITRFRRRCALRWFTVRKLFVLNCAVLLLNVLFYVKNFGSCPSTFLSPRLFTSTVEVQRLFPSTVEVQRLSPSTVEVQRLFPSTVEVQRFSPLTVEDHFQTPLKPEQRALHNMTFHAFTEALDLNNVTYFVFAGTLLGSWRYHDIIPWDDDIDVIIDASDRPEVRRVLRAKVAEDPAVFGLYDWAASPSDFGRHWKFYPQNGQSLLKFSYKTPAIDIFFYLENETHIWNASPQFLKTEIWLKSLVFPLRRRPFGDLMVPAPCNPEAFLRAHFYMSLCQSRRYSHIFETVIPFPSIKVPCSRLAHLYPFVHRDNTTSNSSEEFVLEELRFGNSTLRRFKARKSC